MVLVFFGSGVVSEPRRYSVQLPGTEWLALIGLLGAVLVGVGGLMIAGDILRTLRHPLPAPEPEIDPRPAPAPA